MTYLNLRILAADVIPVSVDAGLPLTLPGGDSGYVLLPLQKGLCGSVDQA